MSKSVRHVRASRSWIFYFWGTCWTAAARGPRSLAHTHRKRRKSTSRHKGTDRVAPNKLSRSALRAAKTQAIKLKSIVRDRARGAIIIITIIFDCESAAEIENLCDRVEPLTNTQNRVFICSHYSSSEMAEDEKRSLGALARREI